MLQGRPKDAKEEVPKERRAKATQSKKGAAGTETGQVCDKGDPGGGGV